MRMIQTRSARVGQHPGKGAQHQHRQKIGERHQAQPGARMGQGPGQPADRDTLQPQPGQRDAVADDIDRPVIAMGKRARDVAEPAGCPPKPLKSQRPRTPPRLFPGVLPGVFATRIAQIMTRALAHRSALSPPCAPLPISVFSAVDEPLHQIDLRSRCRAVAVARRRGRHGFASDPIVSRLTPALGCAQFIGAPRATGPQPKMTPTRKPMRSASGSCKPTRTRRAIWPKAG